MSHCACCSPISASHCRSMKPKCGGCKAILLGSNSSRLNPLRISGCTVSYGTRWSNASTRFNSTARRLRLVPASHVFPGHRQAEQSDSDPNQLPEPPEQREGDAGHVGVAEGTEQQQISAVLGAKAAGDEEGAALIKMERALIEMAERAIAGPPDTR